MIRILVTDGIDSAAAESLRGLGCELVEQFLEPKDLVSQIGEYDAVIVRSATKIEQPVIDAAASGRLRLVIRAGVGVDNIDTEYAKIKGIEVRNTPSASSSAVGELAIAHIFALARHLHESNVTMREGRWEKKAYKGIEISGKTLGIIGFGYIGKSTAQKAKALGMDVVYYDICGALPDAEGCRYVEQDELFYVSDFVSLHLPGSDSPVISSAEIGKMKDGVYIINCARGGLVDEDDLIQALDSGKVAGAGLDVFPDEPAVNKRILCHPRISLSPHIGASTSEAQSRIGDEIIAIMSEYFGM
jgi:D-3-phosphoglycerate dehydrogenase